MNNLLSSTAWTPWDPSTQCKSLAGILGTVIGVVATIAVPFLAPVIGSALGGGFFASIVGQALIGAGIGAIGGGVGAAVSGNSILEGALLGGAGGAVAGGATAFFSGAGLTGAASAAGIGNAAGVAPGAAADSSFFYGSTGVAAGVDGGAAATGALAAGNPSSTTGVVGGAGATAVPTGVAAATTPAGGILSSTAFQSAAIQSLMAGGMQAMKSLLPNDQEAILNQMKSELAVTQGQDQARYEAQLRIFNDYYAYAKSINPEYFAQLARNDESQRQAGTWQTTERQLRGSGYGAAAIASERRRSEVSGVAGLDTATTSGFNMGMNAKDSATRTAAGLYPQAQPDHLYQMERIAQSDAAQSKDQTDGFAGIIAPWQVYAKSKLGLIDNSRPVA